MGALYAGRLNRRTSVISFMRRMLRLFRSL
jgi:hypothetical protein